VESQLDSEVARFQFRKNCDVVGTGSLTLRGRGPGDRPAAGGGLCRRSILIEDVPGVGKTTLSKAMAAALGLKFRGCSARRICCPRIAWVVRLFHPHRGELHASGLGRYSASCCWSTESSRRITRRRCSVRSRQLLDSQAEFQVTVDGQRHELFQAISCDRDSESPTVSTARRRYPSRSTHRFLLHLLHGLPGTRGRARGC